MTIYIVNYEEDGNQISREVYSLKQAKQIMKAHPNSTGSKTKIYANGDWVPCGPIKLKGSNKTFIANSKMNKPNY